MGRESMRIILLLLVACVALASAERTLVDDEMLEGDSGGVGVQYWRVRAITATQGKLEWGVNSLAFYEDQGATKEAKGGEAIASSEYEKKTDPSGKGGEAYLDSKLADAGKKLEKPNPMKSAFDGNEKTYWQSATNEKDEWIGMKFANPVSLHAIKIKALAMASAPSAFIIEKSDDGETWSREIEVTSTKSWTDKVETFSWKPFNTAPESVFAIRNQHNPRWCIGVAPTPDPEDPEADPIPIKFGAALTVQKCDDMKIPQWWTFAKNGLMHNSAGDEYIAHLNATDPKATSSLQIGKCGDGCADNKADILQYVEGKGGGLIRLKTLGKNNLVLGATGGKPAEGAAVVLHQCGDTKEIKKPEDYPDASIGNCADLKHAQWELFPMFQIEKGKQAINCSPYSHMHLKPSPASDRQTAQKLCAKDNRCGFYNWRDGTPGDVKDVSYQCWEIHDVHSAQEGWELGVRAGRAEDFIREEAKQV